MPPKQRTLLGRSTSAKNKMTVSRAIETAEERQSRLERARPAASRAAETLQQRRA